MNPMISGTELALRFPTTAAKLVITCYQQGGDTRNAWDVLVSAYGVREASNLVDLAGRAAGVDSVAVLASIGGVAEISDAQTHSMPGVGPQWELRYNDSGLRVYVGDTVAGRGGKPAVVEGFDPPHKPDAAGRVLFVGGDRLYAHAIGCSYVRVDEPVTFEVVAAGTATVDDGGAVRLDIHPADEAGV